MLLTPSTQEMVPGEVAAVLTSQDCSFTHDVCVNHLDAPELTSRILVSVWAAARESRLHRERWRETQKRDLKE